ncbi:hypothetical protein R1sor_020928 [Riccia sorocarpa]|uniref:Reverse transcriptase domain-containing protein n=1 Tax=Riccia sorocarpa TaxID=122646 RepID=A0ABD3GFK4_9MARC
MAESLGPVLFHASHEANDVKYSHLRACIMREDMINLPNAIIVDLPWGGHYIQEVKYTWLPDSCYKCRQREHKAVDCPSAFKPGPRGGNARFQRGNQHAFRTQANAQAIGTSHIFNTPNRVKRTWKPKTPTKSPKARTDLDKVMGQTPTQKIVSPVTAASNRFAILQEADEHDLDIVQTQQLQSPSPQPERVLTQVQDLEEGEIIPNLDLNEILPTEELAPEALSMVQYQAPLTTDTQIVPSLEEQESLWPPLPLPPKLTQEQHRSLSPLEVMVVAKRRMLFNREASPHEELSQGRSALAKQPEMQSSMILAQNIDPNEVSSEHPDSPFIQVIPLAKIVVDYTVSGRAGAALIAPNNITVIETGTSGIGVAAWAVIETAVGRIKVISLHPPNTKEERTELWSRIEDLLGGGRWVIAGDFNMVEVLEDSKGKSALATGGEARAWKQLAGRNGLIDAYLSAVNTSGGVFTRQAFCGSRFDRARLDRFYISAGAEWLNLIKDVTHRSEQVISDHIPVILRCNLLADSQNEGSPKSYFKMNPAIFKREGILQKLKCAWEKHPLDAGNPQRRWEMAWIRLRNVLKTEKRLMDQENREIHDLRLEVLSLRKITEEREHSNLTDRLKKAEEQLRKFEHEEARTWRLRSRSRWLREGEAPTRYFYSQAKTKFARETIQALQIDEGERTTSRREIIQKVEDFYTHLYEREETTAEVLQARREALQTLTRKVTPDQDIKVAVSPTREEIDLIVKILKADKGPGLDGVTAEALRSCWDFVNNDCYAMIHNFWETGQLIQGTRTAVIKLVPKNDNKESLGNWRPLSLMSITYKIIAKIIAERIKKFLPDLVDPQQVGFIPDRNISSNLLILRLGKDWANMSQQKCIFLKLDFIKAYDRIDHTFMLETLHAMGFTENSLKIFKGLICRGKAKIHVNQEFTKKITLQRGVRQGCPLAPYLFTFCTQILMDMINKAKNEGRISGLQISGGDQLLHQLFADDTGLTLQLDEQVFQETTAVLAKYEKASGAKLNMFKTTVIPLFQGPVPHWLTRSTCHIATASERFRYLGVLAGVDVLEDEITEDVKNKYSKRLLSWTNRMLTWPSKLLLCRNVLGALPYYTLLTVRMSKQGLKLLHKTTREFLWGNTPQGGKKKSLIAWRHFEKRKDVGGLGWPPLQDMAEAFMLRNVMKILTGEPGEWVKLAEEIIKKTLKDSSHPAEIKRWTPAEALMGLKALRIKGSPTLDRMLRSWFKMTKKLRWDTLLGTIPKKGSPRFLAAVALRTGLFSDLQIQEFIKNMNQKMKISLTLQPDWTLADGWTWLGGITHGDNCWKLKTAVWRDLIYNDKDNEADVTKLNEKWEFEENNNFRGVNPILNEVETELQAIESLTRKSTDGEDKVNRARATMNYWKNETIRWHSGARERNEQTIFAETEDPRRNREGALGQDIQTCRNQLVNTWTMDEMIEWQNTEADDTLPRSKRNARGCRRRRTPWDHPPPTEEQRLRLRNYLQDLIDREGTTIETPENDNHAYAGECHAYTSPDNLIRDLLGEQTRATQNTTG